jgi:hypothetical protein
MKNSYALLSLLAVSFVSAANIKPRQASPNHRPHCGNEAIPKPPPLPVLAAANNATSKRLAARQNVKISVPTYIHLVSTKAKNSSISEAVVLQQLIALNDGFNSTPFQFDLRNFTTTINDTYANATTLDTEMLMKRELHQGGYDSLNLYFLSDWAPGNNTDVYGRCYYPDEEILTEYDFYRDGCIIQQYAMPGSPTRPNLNEGKTAVHETGHWLYLIHVWGEGRDGGCVDDDGVLDTPFQREPSNETSIAQGCPVNFSCPTLGGPDNIHNYMDYGSDHCMNLFTIEQSARMVEAWELLRVNRVIGSGSNPIP